jgi:hypothetical protein
MALDARAGSWVSGSTRRAAGATRAHRAGHTWRGEARRSRPAPTVSISSSGCTRTFALRHGVDMVYHQNLISEPRK